MKHLFDLISKTPKPSVTVKKARNGVNSISMDFEDYLLMTSSEVDSYSDSWVNKELERSKLYFYEQIKEA